MQNPTTTLSRGITDNPSRGRAQLLNLVAAAVLAFAAGVWVGGSQPGLVRATWWAARLAGVGLGNGAEAADDFDVSRLLEDLRRQVHTLSQRRDTLTQEIQQTRIACNLLKSQGVAEDAPAYRRQLKALHRQEAELARVQTEWEEAKQLKEVLLEVQEENRTPDRPVTLDPMVRARVKAYLFDRSAAREP